MKSLEVDDGIRKYFLKNKKLKHEMNEAGNASIHLKNEQTNEQPMSEVMSLEMKLVKEIRLR